jgi:hypothetical protein
VLLNALPPNLNGIRLVKTHHQPTLLPGSCSDQPVPSDALSW